LWGSDGIPLLFTTMVTSASPLFLFGFLVVAVAGLVLFVIALRGDPARGRRRCPRCWYDLRGTPGMTCSECGFTGASELDFLRTRRHRWMLIAGPLLLLGGLAGSAGPWLYPVLRHWDVPRYHLQQQVEIGGYRVRVLETNFPEDAGLPRAVEIRRDGALLYHAEGCYFAIGGGTGTASAAARRVGQGEDITGRGVPNLVIESPSGGSGGYSTHYVFELGDGMRDAFQLIAILGSGFFRDVDGDKRPEFIAVDHTFAYRWTPAYQSPQPCAILRFQNDRYVVATDLMRRESPAREAIERELTSLPAGEQFPCLLKTVLDLIFSGHAPLAWDLIDRDWPSQAPDRRQFITEFKAALSESPFAGDLAVLSQPPAGQQR
jgi:hypothetical protein